MKSEKIFFTVSACPDYCGMSQPMSSVFSICLSIGSENNVHARLTLLRHKCTPYARILQMHPIPLYFTIPVYITYVLHTPVYIAVKTSRRTKKVAQGRKDVGFKMEYLSSIPDVLIA